MDITAALLDSWDRQCRIVASVASLIDGDNRKVKSSEDGFSLDAHLGHMHQVRRFFLSQVAPGMPETWQVCFKRTAKLR